MLFTRKRLALLSLGAAALLTAACSTTQPLKPAQEQELFDLYTCARYYHVIADADTGDLFVDRASAFTERVDANPEDMIAVYLRAVAIQSSRVEEHALERKGASPLLSTPPGDEDGEEGIVEKRSMAEALGGTEEVTQLETIASIQVLYDEQCSTLR